MSPGGSRSRKRGVPTGSARSRLDGIGTVGTGEAAGAGVAAVGGAGRGRETHGGVLARLVDGRGARRAQSHSRQQGVPYQLLLLYVGASEWRCGPKKASPSGTPESEERQGRTGSGRSSRRSRSPVWNSSKKESAGRLSLQPGLLRSPCRPRWVRLKPRRKRCRLQAKPARGRDSDRRWRPADNAICEVTRWRQRIPLRVCQLS